MQKKTYEWRMPWFAKGVDPNVAVKELERIENSFGAITPENLVEAARPGNAIFHSLFEWNDQKAAEAYRIQQARDIINNIEVVVISDGQPRQVPAFEIVRKEEGRSYKSIENFTGPDIEQVRMQTIREINALKNKLSFYNKFSKASEKLSEAVDLLNS